MTWNVFANVTQLNTPDLDTNFSNLAAKAVYPCTASGTNSIVLTTAVGDPPVTSYTSRAPIFAFVAAGNSSGSVTVNINGIGAKNLYKSNGAVQCASGDIVSGSVYWIGYDATLNSAAGGFALLSNTVSLGAVTVQTFLGGSGTYTPTVGTVRIRVKMCAGGGGGGAQASNDGTAGNNTTFQVNSTGTAWQCVGGSPGIHNSAAGGAGGTGGNTGSTGTLIARYPGQSGGSGAASWAGIGGGSQLFGGGGLPGVSGSAGGAGTTNSGGGGAGGASATVASGSGGGGGESLEIWVVGLMNAAYSVAATANGGGAGTVAGGAGAAGRIVIEEWPF